MAKIWYSVFGEGYGHATRSTAIIEELQKNHKLLITGFNKSYIYLKERFPEETHKLEGPGFVYKDNKVSVGRTVWEFSKAFPRQSTKNISHAFNLIKRFKPDLIISDFEPTSHYLAYFLRIPIIGIDNMSVLSKCKIDVKKGDRLDYFYAKRVINLFTPSRGYHLILTLKKFKIKKDNVFLFSPVLRKKILNSKSKGGDFILVYQTTQANFKKLIKDFKKIKKSFIIYGTNENRKDKNLLFKKFNESGFIRDLSCCEAVIMTGGFTTISEAVYLKKPMLIVPAENQFEQKFNGVTVKEMKIGDCEKSLDKAKISSFIKNISFYKKNLEKIGIWNNDALINKIEELIKELAPKKKSTFRFVRKIVSFFKGHDYERTMTIIKPDAVEGKLVGEVIKKLEVQGINPVAMKMVKINKRKAKVFYKHLKGKIPDSVFNSIIDYVTSNRVVLVVWQGNGVISKIREICGPTDPKKAIKVNIRDLSGDDMKRKFKKGRAVKNIIHSSATPEEAKREIKAFFFPWEIHKL